MTLPGQTRPLYKAQFDATGFQALGAGSSPFGVVDLTAGGAVECLGCAYERHALSLFGG